MAKDSLFSFLAGATVGALAFYLLGTEKGKETTQKAADDIKSAAAPIVDKAQDVCEEVKNKAGDFAESARDAISKGLDKIEDALERKPAPAEE